MIREAFDLISKIEEAVGNDCFVTLGKYADQSPRLRIWLAGI